jgi:ligand-binding sensor domain-containing protein
MNPHRRTVAVLAIAAAALSLITVAAVLWRVQQTLRSSERALAAQEQLPFELRTLGELPNPGFEAMSAPAVYKAAASFQGLIYLSGPAGLYAWSAEGTLDHIYRTGLELPAAPLGAMQVGTLADSRQPELLIATFGEGVLAFDGHLFRQIRPADPESRKITALLPLSSGQLLMGTPKRGLLVYDGKVLRKFHKSTSDLYVTALAGNQSELWVGTLNQGVAHWHGGQADWIAESNGLPDSRVESISLQAFSVYIGTPVGVAEIRQGKVARTLAPGRYAHTLLAQGETLMVGQIDAGVLPVSLASQTPATSFRRAISLTREPAPNRASSSAIVQFLSIDDTRYALTTNSLLRQDTDGSWRSTLTGAESMLTDRNISSLLVASDGRLWVGYFDRGLDILPANGAAATHIEDEHLFCVNRIAEDRQRGSVAVATANGLVMFNLNGQQKQILTRESGLIASHVTDVAPYGEGWVAATPAGITFLDPSGAHSLYAFQGLVNNHVYALGLNSAQPLPNQLLVGTLGGLSLLTNGTVRRNLTTANSGLSHNWITGLVPNGNDWLIGTYGGGVMRMDADGKVTPTEATKEDVVVNPTAMLTDGTLVLAGTLGQGLLVGDATGTRWKTITAGLPSMNVTALAIDKGFVYVGTENGLVKIPESKL